jgi:predicted glutamine amidotransferase
MCIAIYKPKNIVLKKEILKECWMDNPDGAGFAYRTENKSGEEIIIHKGYMRFKSFWSAYTKLSQSLEMVIHFRFATHGLIDKHNTHPFGLLHGGAFAHNGILGELEEEPIRSDTRIFVEDVLNLHLKKNKGFGSKLHEKRILEMALGRSKGLLMLQGEKTVILNEAKGLWAHGCWFSNDGFKPYTPKKVTTWNYTSPFPRQNTSPSFFPSNDGFYDRYDEEYNEKIIHWSTV